MLHFTLATHFPYFVTFQQATNLQVVIYALNDLQWQQEAMFQGSKHIPKDWAMTGETRPVPQLLCLGKSCLHRLCPLLQPSPLCPPTIQSTGGS